jgi:hypothetical protein
MTYYNRIASSTQSDVLCRWDGVEATREVGSDELESPQPRTCIFRVKNRVTLTCEVRVEGLPGIFKKILTFLTLVCTPSTGTKGSPFVSNN